MRARLAEGPERQVVWKELCDWKEVDNQDEVFCLFLLLLLPSLVCFANGLVVEPTA